MSKAQREVILDVNELSNTNIIPEEEEEDFFAPRKLPVPLANLKQYVDSKFCYYSKPINIAEIISVEPKIAYQCSMKILTETRKLRMVVRPHPWKTEKVWGSRGLGRLVEDTEITGEAVGNMWTDYSIPIPSTDRSKQVFSLSESTCRGAGKVACGDCNGLGGFRHVPTLTVKWFTRQSIWFYQNSFLHTKKIRKGQRILIWSVSRIPWSKAAAIEGCVQTIREDTRDIPLRENIIQDYHIKHLNPVQNKNNEMRRLDFSIERMNFEEVRYTMGEDFVNKREPTLDNTFRFCQYPGNQEQTLIYENDYPYNCCGCFGEKAACYVPCCTIL
ncbi:hypothetical protein I4U23_022652 [Adineta vaga]|nr:hypothetical protein I4U23_022652 [Adineta vaga]